MLLVVFKLKSVSETAWREPPKKWDLLLLIDLIWVEDILILGYTKIFVISYIPGSKPPNILYWISKGTFEIATKVFKLSGLVISEKKCEMKISLFFKWVKFEVLRGWIKQPDVENLSHKANWNNSIYYKTAQSVLAQPKNKLVFGRYFWQWYVTDLCCVP